ncbi:Rieske 2Fe-2S domain-containing protein [Chitinophagaceae bacterium LB-8]|uniref:Rieske 2Fe-2S domain-containing protein n=1 Tax=Paraflavisolibacter caeni TaxID=2982496 RepID=A0A9X2XYQ8_9BACT|nr:DUF2231 domain-containing protein [Paraflavisolibacter caeni]MCU7552004.1 Rieske 2Fe-2S domain-containing protein [Paraflavisolibacter caeni]
MKSKAHIKTHPLHPILVAFPIAFFIGAFIFDFLSLATTNLSFWQTGYYLSIAGITGALLAAVPGAVDYFFTVPPNSSAKKRATKHALINLLNVFLFGFAVYYRGTEAASTYVILTIEGIGVILLSIAGWLGGTLVHRNQIGIDHRYAQAGKWKESYFEQSSGKIEVATIDELKVNGLKLLHVAGKRIALGRTEKGYVAFDDHCTHKGGSLADGVLMCNTIHCPWHGSHFDVETGKVKAGPAKQPIATYQVAEQDGKVFLLL